MQIKKIIEKCKYFFCERNKIYTVLSIKKFAYELHFSQSNCTQFKNAQIEKHLIFMFAIILGK